MEQTMTRTDRHNLRAGLLFISPWIIGFLSLCIYPLLSSFYNSLCDYSVLSPAVFVGAANYRDLFTDAIFWKALYNTVFFAGFPSRSACLSRSALAILLNFDLPLKGVFRTIFFLPITRPDGLPRRALAVDAERRSRPDQQRRQAGPAWNQRPLRLRISPCRTGCWTRAMQSGASFSRGSGESAMPW
jgi:hypothetical protein